MLALVPWRADAQPAPSDTQLCSRAADARFPEARSRLQAMTTAPRGAGAFAQGCLAMADGRFEQAAAAFERAVAERDDSAVYHFWLGQAYGAQAQRANVLRQASLARRTKREFDRAVALDPDFLDAREGLMQYYLLAPGVMGGSKERAREQLGEIRTRNAYRGALLAASLAARDKDWATATRELAALAQQAPDSSAPIYALVAAHGQQGRWDDAWTVVDRWARRTNDGPLAQYLVGRTAAESGQQVERGVAALGRYLQHQPRQGEPSLASAHYRLGELHERQGARDRARAEYEEALRLEPRLTQARRRLEKLR